MKAEDATSFKSRSEWREWLRKNHGTRTEIWLLIFKKSAGAINVPYEDAVEEAICFGWIDGKLRRIDERCHAIRFTPRRPGGIWSESNRKRAERMIREGRMERSGLDQVAEAKRNGRWASAYAAKKVPAVPTDLKEALRGNPIAQGNFNAFSNSNKSSYIYWILSAKKEDTRTRRIHEVVARSAIGRKPGA